MLGEIFGVDSIIVLVVVVAVLFGGSAIPKLARNLGSAKTEFKKGLDTAAGVSTTSALRSTSDADSSVI